MADYFPLISRAVSALSPNTKEARESIYARAREALSRQLQSLDPPIPDADLWAERNALEETIRRIEAQFPAAPRSEVRPVVPVPDLQPARMPDPAPRAAAPAAPAQPAAAPAFKLPQAGAAQRPAVPKPVAPTPVAPTPMAPTPAPAGAAAKAAPSPPAVSLPKPGAGPVPSRPVPAPPVQPGKPARGPAVVDPGAPEAEVVAPAGTVDEQALDGQVKRPKVVHRDATQGFGRRLTALLIALPAMLGLGALAYVLRDDPASYERREAEAPAADPAVPARKADGRLDGTASTGPATGPRPGTVVSVPALPVAARAIFFEETTNDPRGQQSDGQVIWRIENPTGSSQPVDPAVRASITFPSARMGLEMVFKRNRDRSLPASHTVELVFRPEGERDGVVEIGPIEARDQETQPGYQLRGAMVPVGVNLFLVGLDRSEQVAERNVEAMRDHRFFAFQFRLSTGRVGAVLVEKGAAGDRVFREATDIWRRN